VAHPGRPRRVGQDDDRPRVVEDGADLRVREGRVDAGVRRPRLEDRELGEVDVFRRPREQNRDDALAGHELAEGVGEGVGEAVEFGVGDGEPGRAVGSGRGVQATRSGHRTVARDKKSWSRTGMA